ncbi:uncharacterized protein LOC125939639 isoform X1 [Dermacentor silvarum]|uniref:uncharacterized protein LOC125939639 isoform X1 n=1 Tax=Dermacentor silvarum TaxID=543639 RepID=UPI0018975B38|nr:uncharacterized protein LOC125939639 isoform X1 [Dermacentor silvarum]
MAPVNTGSRPIRLTTESLLQAVKEFPCLYYRGHPSYKDYKRRQEVWSSIGARFGITGFQVQSKFKNAKDTYKRAKDSKPRPGQVGKHGNKPWPSWKHFDAMHELLDSPTAPLGSAEQDVPSTEDSESIMSFGSITIDYEPDDTCEEKPVRSQGTETTCNGEDKPVRSQGTETTCNGVVPPTHKTEDTNEDLSSVETTMVNSMATCVEHLKMLHDERKESGFKKDKVYQFCMYVASCIRGLNKRDQLEAMQEINTVMYNYQKKHLENT